MNVPRIVVAATGSGSGKTLLVCGLLRALQKRGLNPVSFKCGPDYIDPMFHTRVLGNKSRNLDTYFTDEDTTRYLFAKAAKGASIAVIEGVMGYYDGLGGIDTKASAYDVAKVMEAPVILIVNCKGMSLSILSVIQGFMEFRKDSGIKGILLNQISSSLYPVIRDLIVEQCQVPVVGYVPNRKEMRLESRHLGLLLPEEVKDLESMIDQLAVEMEDTIELDLLIQIAQGGGEVKVQKPEIPHLSEKVRIGVARDEAFCFFYEDNLELLQEMGAELVWFSPLRDSQIPKDIHGLLLMGGYPELYGKELSENQSMRSSIQKALRGGIPCMAECGGFLYLQKELEGTDGNVYPMAGVILESGFHTHKLSRFGYVNLSWGENPWETIKGHEFHYYDTSNPGQDALAKKPVGSRTWRCMYINENQMMGFPHLYYYSNPQVPYAFLQKCQIEKMKKKEIGKA